MATPEQNKLLSLFIGIINASNSYSNNQKTFLYKKDRLRCEDADEILQVLIKPFCEHLTSHISGDAISIFDQFRTILNYNSNKKFIMTHVEVTSDFRDYKPFDEITHEYLLNLILYIHSIKDHIAKSNPEEKNNLIEKLNLVDKLTVEMIEKKFEAESACLIEQKRQLQQATENTNKKLGDETKKINEITKQLAFICETEKQIVGNIKIDYEKGNNKFKEHKHDSIAVRALFLENGEPPINSLFKQCQLVAKKKETSRTKYRREGFQANTLSEELKIIVKSVEPTPGVEWRLEEQDGNEPPKLITNHEDLKTKLSNHEQYVSEYKQAIADLTGKLEETDLEIVKKRQEYHRPISSKNNDHVETTSITVDQIDGNINIIYRALSGNQENNYVNNSTLEKAKELHKKYKDFDTKPYEKLQLITEIHDYRLYQKYLAAALLILIFRALISYNSWKQDTESNLAYKFKFIFILLNCIVKIYEPKKTEPTKRMAQFNNYVETYSNSTSAEIHKALNPTACPG